MSLSAPARPRRLRAGASSVARAGWILALAGLSFGGLWVAQYYGPQAMPDEWVAFSSLAAVGFFLRATGQGRPPADPYLRFGSPLARLRAAGAERGGFGLHPGVWDELRALNGPTLCRPCTVGLRYPELSLWWLALPVLAILGVLAARRADRLSSSLLAAACGLCVAFQYLFLIDYAAPRFLLPAYALLAIPVADALAWMIAGVSADTRPLTRAIVAVGLAVQLLAQHLVLDHEVAGTVAFHDDYIRIVADLRQAGIAPPCLIKGDQDIPIAYYAGCASAPSAPSWARRGADADRIALLATSGAPVPGYARHWQLRRLPGTRVLRLVAYLPRR